MLNLLAKLSSKAAIAVKRAFSRIATFANVKLVEGINRHAVLHVLSLFVLSLFRFFHNDLGFFFFFGLISLLYFTFFGLEKLIK